MLRRNYLPRKIAQTNTVAVETNGVLVKHAGIFYTKMTEHLGTSPNPKHISRLEPTLEFPQRG